MILHDEIYFEITLEGRKSELEKFASYATSGVFDDFFDVSEDYIIYDDNHEGSDESDRLTMVFTNDEYGIELDRFDTEEFLEILCKGAKALFVNGTLYDIDDEEYRFTSGEGSSDFMNAKHTRYNDELDEVAADEDVDDEDYDS